MNGMQAAFGPRDEVLRKVAAQRRPVPAVAGDAKVSLVKGGGSER
jgi:hypothetical protein